MARKCAHCGSLETQTQADAYQCLICGNITSVTGDAIQRGDRTERFLNPEVTREDPSSAPYGNPAGSSRTPDGVADPGTNISGPVPKNQGEAVRTGEMRDDDLMKGNPEGPPKLDRDGNIVERPVHEPHKDTIRTEATAGSQEVPSPPPDADAVPDSEEEETPRRGRRRKS